MTRMIDADDVIDAGEIATMLGLSHSNTVSLYQRRYPAMPRPVNDMGQGRCKLWLRSEIDAWSRARSKLAKCRPDSGKATPATE